MQVINNISVSNAHGVYFPDLYSPWANMVMEDGILCTCDDFLQTFVSTDTIYVQVQTPTQPRIEVNGVVFNITTGSLPDDIYNIPVSLAQFAGQIIQLRLIIPGLLNPDNVFLSHRMFVQAVRDNCHALLEWRSECEAQGIDYTTDPNFINRMWVPIRYIRPSLPDTTTYNAVKNSSGYWDFCSSDLDEVWTVAIKEVPDWMLQIISKAVNNSSFWINGTEYFSIGGIRATERRCCLRQAEIQVSPKQADNSVIDCCINDFSGFQPVSTAVISCATPPQGVNTVVVDTRGALESNGATITAASSNVTYLFQMGTEYYVSIAADADPTLPASWNYLGGAGTSGEFNTNIVGNITIPVGGFAGYFEIDCAGLTAIGVTALNISMSVNDGVSTSSNAACTVTC